MIGCTVSTIGGIGKGIDRAALLGYQCTQIYTTDSRTWNVDDANLNNLKKYAELSKINNVQLIAHAPLIINLASKDEVIRTKSYFRLRQEVCAAHKCGISTLVLHPGSTLDNDTQRGINCIIDAIDSVADICAEYNVNIALETMSGQGTQLGSNFEELSHIICGVRDNSHVKICLDTCHIHAAGYNIYCPESLNYVLGIFDKLIGLHRITAFQLNNTKTECGKKADRHSSIFDGKISIGTFSSLVCNPRFNNLPMIIEPPAKDATGPEQVRYLQNIVKGNKYESR